MTGSKRYFFCGIGGSGMMPLALILRARGHAVDGLRPHARPGADRAEVRFSARPRDPALSAGWQRSRPIPIRSWWPPPPSRTRFPTCGRRIALGVRRMSRADLLADLFNAAPIGIGVAGTSGKSTTTGMIGWILHQTGRSPTIVNGAVMKNFVTVRRALCQRRWSETATCSSPRWTRATAPSRSTPRRSRCSTTSRSTTSRWTNCAGCSGTSSPRRERWW